MPDLWNKKNEDIMKIAEKKSGKKAVNVFRTSGIYVYVKNIDNSFTTVYDKEVL